MYQDERKLDFKPLGIAIKKAREAKGWTQEYLAQLVDLTPRSIMYIENRGQHPRLNKFYLITGYTYWGSDNFLIHISLTRHRKRYVLTVLSCHSFTINVIRNLTFGYRKVYLLPLYGL